MTVVEVTEIEIFQFHTVLGWLQTLNRLEADAMRLITTLVVIFYQMTITYCGKFSWVLIL